MPLAAYSCGNKTPNTRRAYDSRRLEGPPKLLNARPLRSTPCPKPSSTASPRPLPPHDVHDGFLRLRPADAEGRQSPPGAVQPHGGTLRHRPPLFLSGAGQGRGGGCRRLLSPGRLSRHGRAHEEVRGLRAGPRGGSGRKAAQGRRPFAHHPCDRHQLHGLFRARHRPGAGGALRTASPDRRAHHGRLHGLLCRDQRA